MYLVLNNSLIFSHYYTMASKPITSSVSAEEQEMLTMLDVPEEDIKANTSVHTAGPWHICGQKEYKVFSESARTDEGYVKGYIAELIFREADAILIAAAPELLEACRELQKWLDSHFGTSEHRKLISDAIAKAEGRA
jgi:hypothetical protein